MTEKIKYENAIRPGTWNYISLYQAPVTHLWEGTDFLSSSCYLLKIQCIQLKDF